MLRLLRVQPFRRLPGLLRSLSRLRVALRPFRSCNLFLTREFS
jgi:hypothetical protein